METEAFMNCKHIFTSERSYLFYCVSEVNDE